MRPRRLLIAAAAVSGALALTAGAAGASPRTPAPAAPISIAGLLLADAARDDADGFDRRGNDYDIVTQAVLAFPDLTEAASGPGPLTVFAPNDRAFRILVWDLTHTWPKTEKETFDAVVGLGLDTVKTVLTYHILGRAVSYADAVKADDASIATLQGGAITVDVKGSKRHPSVRLVDLDPNARNPRVIAANVGGQLTNGYVHGIDRVLRPLDL